jgi:hypothetical protein
MRARRREVVDEYLEDGRSAIYTNQGMVVLLSELATSAWTLLGDDWVTAEKLAIHLVDEYGEPGGESAKVLTERTLTSLAEMAVVDLDGPGSVPIPTRVKTST